MDTEGEEKGKKRREVGNSEINYIEYKQHKQLHIYTLTIEICTNTLQFYPYINPDRAQL